MVETHKGFEFLEFGSIKLALFIEVPVIRQEGWRSCICVLGVMYLCVRSINFASFYIFSNEFWSCSDSVVFFVFLIFL
jgi:hypothetical protein